MSASCTRLWEVEAARDGRLDDRALEKAQKHRGHCVECRQEHARLASIGALLNDAEHPSMDELGAKRLRARILADAERELRRETPEVLPRPRSLRTGLAVAAVLVSTVGAYGALHRAAAPQKAAVNLVDEGGARFSRTTQGDVAQVTLSEGTMRFAVTHDGAGPHKLLVKVPDGEVEDIGTTFHVTVHDGRTVRVVVDDGRVVVHTKESGAHGRIVSAGEVWEAAPPLASSDPSVPAPSATPAPTASTVTSPAKVTATPPHDRPKALAASAAKSDGSSTPNEAVPASVPSSSVGEDTAYLTVVRLLREGRRDEAKAAARRYVVLYPGGLRRKEMDVVAE